MTTKIKNVSKIIMLILFISILVFESIFHSVQTAGAHDELYPTSLSQQFKCVWKYNHQLRKHICYNKMNQDVGGHLDHQEKLAGNLPIAHENCQGRRTLSKDGNGQFHYGCQE